MRRGVSRTGVAVLLAAAAVIVPCSAWYAMGGAAARADAEEMAQAPLRQAGRIALQMAERLGARLESMREAESRRPFHHYQQLYHDPTGSCECAAPTPSPLAGGPADPLVWTHFQIDPSYRLTLPTLAAASPEEEGEWFCDQLSIREALEDAVFHAVAVLDGPSPFLDGGPRPAAEPMEPGSSEPMDVRSVEDFGWYTVEMADGPALVAMRRVFTGHGRWVQGFVISFRGIKDLLADATFPARILPRRSLAPAEGRAEAALPLPGVAWLVLVDAAEKAVEAEAKGKLLLASFHRLFLTGTGLALLAAVCMVWLVHQSDRLARQRARFAAAAAHELRTPLAGMRLYGEMLAEGLGDPQRRRDYAGRIAAESERLGRVVSNVLGYTHLERGGLAVQPRPGDLAATVADAVERLRPTVSGHGARLELEVEGPLPPVDFDPDAVHQILQNLVDNAEKYTRRALDRRVTVRLRRRGRGVALEVRDRGEGVDEPTRRHLFEPFVRGGPEDAPGGLGLGLVLVRSLAAAHGGDVGYERAPGGGALFRVTFPGGAAA